MLENLPAAVGHALKAIRPGVEKTVYHGIDAPETIQLTSPAFSAGGPIPARFTEDGARVSPPLAFVGVPTAAKSLTLIVEDADSPTPAPLCHALVWAIPPRDGGLDEAALDADAMPTLRGGLGLGKHSFLKTGWLPPDPPTGHGAHRYVFQLYALDREPALDDGAGRGAVVESLEGHVLAKGMLIGLYERPG